MNHIRISLTWHFGIRTITLSEGIGGCTVFIYLSDRDKTEFNKITAYYLHKHEYCFGILANVADNIKCFTL